MILLITVKKYYTHIYLHITITYYSVPTLYVNVISSVTGEIGDHGS
jgi:hypothetical protein